MSRQAQLPVVALLVGLPGTGKYTLGAALVRDLVARDHAARLIDNHYVANPILELVRQDGVTPLPADVWERVAEVREAVLKTVEELSPAELSFVFTADISDDADDLAFVERLSSLAQSRRARLVVVRLICDLHELRKRIVVVERRDRLKSVSEEDATERHHAGVPKLTAWSPVTLDVTSLTIEQAVGCLAAIVTGAHD